MLLNLKDKKKLASRLHYSQCFTPFFNNLVNCLTAILQRVSRCIILDSSCAFFAVIRGFPYISVFLIRPLRHRRVELRLKYLHILRQRQNSRHWHRYCKLNPLGSFPRHGELLSINSVSEGILGMYFAGMVGSRIVCPLEIRLNLA